MLKVVGALIPALLRLLTPELVKTAVNAFIEVIEDASRNSTNTVDDALVLPLCKTIRTALDVPDVDGDNG
jgi:hypothetical protein